MLRRCRRLVVRDHSDSDAIGVVDESGTAKSGRHTVGGKRQYNGNRGCPASLGTGISGLVS
jgi:SRSO17 transposase